MGTVFLIVDDAHQRYFDTNKWWLPEEARECQLFETFLAYANGGHEPALLRSHRYAITVADAQRVYAFLKAAEWKVRVVGDCWDDPFPGYFDCLRLYDAADALSSPRRGACAQCKREVLLLEDPFCAKCEWEET